jgi:DNA-binding response OmpR family regulator
MCRECVQAVVLDVSIGTDDGLAVCEGLKDAVGVPFVLLSENASRKAVANAIRSGAASVLVKPIKEELLIERLAEVLKTRRTSTPGPG